MSQKILLLKNHKKSILQPTIKIPFRSILAGIQTNEIVVLVTLTTPVDLENGEKCDGSQIFDLVLTQYRHNLKRVGNLTVKARWQTDAKCTHRLRMDQSRSRCSVWIIFERSHNAVSKMCRLDFGFQNIPFSKSAGKNVPFSC